MSNGSKIEWTEATWNPTTGCTKVSTGCTNCYAEKLSLRLMNIGIPKYKNGFKLTIHEDALNIPLGWKSPRTIFVNSMSDLFHKDVPLRFIKKVFKTMKVANWHQYQILTKRPDRILELDKKLDWQNHIWMGTSVENENYVKRIDYLRKTSAAIKFLSLEPLLGPLPNLNLKGIDWVIVGGESGPRARPIEENWVMDIKRQCKKSGVAFFFKQWGGLNKKSTGRELKGKTYNEMPTLKLKIPQIY